MHVATGIPYYTYHRKFSSDSDSGCGFPHDPDLTFFTYVESIVYDAELSDVAITYFVEALTAEKYPATSRLHIGLSLVSATSSDYVVGYVLDPDKMEFKHFNKMRVGVHFQLKNTKIVTKELIGTLNNPKLLEKGSRKGCYKC